jgi:hypothetical protein
LNFRNFACEGPAAPGHCRAIEDGAALASSDVELMTEKQVLGFKRAPRLVQIDDEHPSEFRIASIGRNHAMILPNDTNPGKIEFSKDGTKSAGFTPLDNRRPNTRMPARPARAQPAPS